MGEALCGGVKKSVRQQKSIVRCNMKQLFLVSLGLIFSIMSGFAQTNAPSPTGSHFVLPPIQLWEPASPQDKSSELTLAVPPSPQLSGSTQRVALNTIGDDTEFRSRVIRPGQFYLTAPEPKSENRVVRAAEAIWSPEVVKVGKTSISCSLITAIKRKNPLCLINPIFFQASW
jgi:hypothetical protein